MTVEGEGAEEIPQTADHLALRAFALVAPVEGRRFRFVNRIPLERGLGSSAATIAAGLVAGAAAAGRTLSPDELLDLGLPLEGHPDNLAAALRGGVCLIWQNGAGPHTARIAVDLPLAAIVVVPSERVNTAASRSPAAGDPDPRRGRRGRGAGGAAWSRGRRRRRVAARERVPRHPPRALPRRRRAAPRRAARQPGHRHRRRDALGLRPVGRRLGREGRRSPRRPPS